MTFHAYQDRDMWAIEVANVLAEDLTSVLDHQERALFVVPGGSTPGPVFDLLNAADLDWSRINVTLSDERWVPEDDARSNTGLLRRRLLVGKAAKARLLPLYLPLDQPEQGIEKLAKSLEPHLPISVLLLGMGADMHTASLFPATDGLAKALAPDAPSLVAIHPKNQEPRISFSAAALDRALSKHLLITGDAKRAAFETAQTRPPDQAPVSAILQGTHVHWAP